jgi:hypothetical protein
MDTFTRIALASVIGFLGGLIAMTLVQSGAFQQWSRLETPPVPAAKLAGTSFYSVYIQATDHKVYLHSCITPQQCWQMTPTLTEHHGGACDFSSTKFAITTNPPRNVADCLQGVFPGADWSTDYGYVLDRDGIVWEWTHSGSYSTFIMNWLLVGAFTIIGAFIGVVWSARS